MSIASSLYQPDVSSSVDSCIWIGLDFGTATTECVVRVETRGMPDEVLIVASSGLSRADSVVVIPSAVELDNGVMRTGIHLSGSGNLIDHFKLGLIEELEASDTSLDLYRADGPFAHALFHVASVIAMARGALEKHLPGRKLGYYLNIAAPIGADPDNPAHQRVRHVFHELAFRALELSNQVQCWPVSEHNVESLLQQSLAVQVPGFDFSPVFVVPESLAAVTAFLHAPNRTAGNYAAIDVGGGSTDISFFWFQTGQYATTGEKRAWYYSIRSEPVGMSNLLNELRESIQALDGRTQHERLRAIPSLSKHAHRESVRKLLADVETTYKQAFRDCFLLRPNFADWCDDGVGKWNLLLLGGGMSDNFIRDHLEDYTPHQMVKRHREVDSLGAPQDLNLMLPSGQILHYDPASLGRFEVDMLTKHSHMLTVAFGLSFRAPDIPRYGLESPVAPPKPPPPWEPSAHNVYLL